MILKIILSLLILFMSVSGQADFLQLEPIKAVEAGIGEWHEVPFGKVRVLSCTTGVKDLSMVVGGIQVDLSPDWVMKKPTLKPLSDKMPSWLETPVRPGSGKNTIYEKQVFFPLVYTRNATDTGNFELGAQGEFPVCQGDKCMTLPLRMGLWLKADEADYTTACSYIIKEQLQTPLMAEAQGVKGNAWVEHGEVIMAFSGIKSPINAFLQTTEQDSFQVQETRLEKTGVIMRVKTNAWDMGHQKDWILITNKGVFRVPVIMQNSAIALPKAPHPFSVWWIGWELFFMTPLFIWWGLGMMHANKDWKKEILKFCLFVPPVFLIRFLLEKYTPLNWGAYAIILLILVCLFPPIKKERALVVFFVWPFFPKIPSMPVGTSIIWFGVMCAEMLIPFVFLYLKMSEIRKVLQDLKKKNFFLYNLIFLLPTVYLLGWNIVTAFQKDVVFQNEIKQGKINLVVDEKGAQKWQKIPEVSFISADSMMGQSLQKIYERKAPVIIWQDDWGRVILPPNSSLSEVSESMSNWQRYHALYMP